jgi:SAM-dependent methyltransferase
LPYSSQDYWQALHERAGLSAVGQSALPDEINGWLYRTLARNLRGFLRHHHIRAVQGARLLEIGVGKGYWLPFWRRLGWAVDGCDLIPAAVVQLQREQADGRFWVADVSQEGGLGTGVWQLVTCLNVLLHVTSDDLFERSLRNVAAAVAPGGHLLLAEPILMTAEHQAPFDAEKHSRARLLAGYVEPLRACGLELVAAEHGCVLANNPIEAGSPRAMQRYRSWWQWVAKRSKANPASARWMGPLVYGLDWIAMRTNAAPTTKFALFVRPIGD